MNNKEIRIPNIFCHLCTSWCLNTQHHYTGDSLCTFHVASTSYLSAGSSGGVEQPLSELSLVDVVPKLLFSSTNSVKHENEKPNVHIPGESEDGREKEQK